MTATATLVVGAAALLVGLGEVELAAATVERTAWVVATAEAHLAEAAESTRDSRRIQTCRT